MVGVDCAKHRATARRSSGLLLVGARTVTPRVPWVDRCVVLPHALHQRIHCLLPFTKLFQCQRYSLHLLTIRPSEKFS